MSYPWAHLDIAGTAWDVKDVSYLPSRATGYGARLFAELAAGWGGAKIHGAIGVTGRPRGATIDSCTKTATAPRQS